jgi:hypothetical protein
MLGFFRGQKGVVIPGKDLLQFAVIANTRPSEIGSFAGLVVGRGRVLRDKDAHKKGGSFNRRSSPRGDTSFLLDVEPEGGTVTTITGEREAGNSDSRCRDGAAEAARVMSRVLD